MPPPQLSAGFEIDQINPRTLLAGFSTSKSELIPKLLTRLPYGAISFI